MIPRREIMYPLPKNLGLAPGRRKRALPTSSPPPPLRGWKIICPRPIRGSKKLRIDISILFLEYWGGLTVGHGLWARMQWWTSAVEYGAFEGIVVQYLLRVLQLGEPHAHVFKVYA